MIERIVDGFFVGVICGFVVLVFVVMSVGIFDWLGTMYREQPTRFAAFMVAGRFVVLSGLLGVVVSIFKDRRK